MLLAFVLFEEALLLLFGLLQLGDFIGEVAVVLLQLREPG